MSTITNTKRSRVVRFAQEGGPEVLRIDTIELPPPAAGEVRVAIEAIGLNRAEAMYRGGYYYERPARFPAVLGYEAAGVVEAIGAEVTGFAPGDAVSVVPAFSMRDYGVYGEHVNVPARSLVRRPQGQSAIEGAAVWMAGITAYGGLIEIGKLRAGDTVLLTAATGSIGLAALQVAQRVGAHAIATTRNPQKRAALLQAGASAVIVTGEGDLVSQVRDLTGGRGADLVFDALAGSGVSELAAATASGGRLLLYGFLHQPQVAGAFGSAITPFPLTNWSIDMRWYAAGQDVAADPARMRRAQAFVLSGLRTGTLTAVIDRTFDFDDIVAAHRYLESNTQVGKVVVSVSGR
ncbi:MAG: zinc-dependent alcohol dehydrogenase family protein [Polyangiales bacterium]